METDRNFKKIRDGLLGLLLFSLFWMAGCWLSIENGLDDVWQQENVEFFFLMGVAFSFFVVIGLASLYLEKLLILKVYKNNNP